MLHILLRVVEAHLRRSSPGASAQARFGAVSFVRRFGASLNRHLHYHCCILDGVFDPLQAGGVQFRQASFPDFWNCGRGRSGRARPHSLYIEGAGKGSTRVALG